MLEEAEEQLDRPAMPINVSHDLRRNVQQIRGDAQDSIARRSRSTSLAAASLLVRRALDQHEAHGVVRPRGSFAGRAQRDH